MVCDIEFNCFLFYQDGAITGLDLIGSQSIFILASDGTISIPVYYSGGDPDYLYFRVHVNITGVNGTLTTAHRTGVINLDGNSLPDLEYDTYLAEVVLADKDGTSASVEVVLYYQEKIAGLQVGGFDYFFF